MNTDPIGAIIQVMLVLLSALALLVGLVVLAALAGIASWRSVMAVLKRFGNFAIALGSVLVTLVLWAVIFRVAYWIAHGLPRVESPSAAVNEFLAFRIHYAPLDYLLLLASLAVAAWPVFSLLNPPEDSR